MKTSWSYADVPSWGQTVGERLITCEWFELIGYELLHWGHLLWEQNDDLFRDLTIHFPVDILMSLIMQCFSFCISHLHHYSLSGYEASANCFFSFCFSFHLVCLCVLLLTPMVLNYWWDVELVRLLSLRSGFVLLFASRCHAVSLHADASMHMCLAN